MIPLDVATDGYLSSSLTVSVGGYLVELEIEEIADQEIDTFFGGSTSDTLDRKKKKTDKYFKIKVTIKDKQITQEKIVASPTKPTINDISIEIDDKKNIKINLREIKIS